MEVAIISAGESDVLLHQIDTHTVPASRIDKYFCSWIVGLVQLELGGNVFICCLSVLSESGADATMASSSNDSHYSGSRVETPVSYMDDDDDDDDYDENDEDD